MSLPAGDERSAADAPPAPPPEPPARPGLRFAVTLAVLLVVGVELSLLGGFLALTAPAVLGVTLPLGPLIGPAANVAAGVWAVRATGSRLALAALAAGWVVTALVLGMQRPEGDLVLPGSDVGGGRSYAFLLLGSLAWAVPAIVRRPATSRDGAVRWFPHDVDTSGTGGEPRPR